jgi:tetratricopeptide (TPR) repeat protein
MDPESLPALKGLARVCALGKQGARARQLLKRAAELAPDDPAVRKMLAALGPEPAGEEGEPQSAHPPESAETNAAEEDNEPIATATIAEIYVKQGLLNKALKVYGDLVRGNPDNDRLRERYQALSRQVAGQTEAGGAEAESNVAPPSEETEPSPSGEALVLERLESWLTAIRDRRDDVH